MCWIDCRKAYDMVTHSWIMEFLAMFKIANNVKNLLQYAMPVRKFELPSNNQNVRNVVIKRRIFQGDSLSSLLYINELSNSKDWINHLLYMGDRKLCGKTNKSIDLLIQTVRIFSSNISMEFGIGKCNILILKRGIKDKNYDIILLNDPKVSSLKEGENYKYRGIFKAEDINTKQMKEKVEAEYLRRTRKVLESKLNRGNLFKAINTWPVPLFRYSAASVDWKKEKISETDRRTRKLLNMHKAQHPKDDEYSLYIKREKGGRGFISIEECD